MLRGGPVQVASIQQATSFVQEGAIQMTVYKGRKQGPQEQQQVSSKSPAGIIKTAPNDQQQLLLPAALLGARQGYMRHTMQQASKHLRYS
jgi:hypothetical protein